ncbi:hypothetical protein JS533_005730 [Bifidobacterium amazonense]|uniref:Uncharacterized protein n=1 Tax=Bifidobacterium amazonense TaxID=2809027 RepID=A0ABS9VUJ3_9BIFI|nr:hypothetical protein [Bifidobacterium amazonense]MCH9275770.1 hypothetical protein [Bifidobacterium amazonense]
MGNAVVRRRPKSESALEPQPEPQCTAEEWQGSRQPVRQLIRRRLWQTFGPAVVVAVLGVAAVICVWIMRDTIGRPLFADGVSPWEYVLIAVGLLVLAVAGGLALHSVVVQLPYDMVGVRTDDDFPLRLVRKPHDNRDLELEDPDYLVSAILFSGNLDRVFKVLELDGGEADVCWTIMQVSDGRLRVVDRDAVDTNTRLACAEQYSTDDLTGIPLDDNCEYDQRNSVLIVR